MGCQGFVQQYWKPNSLMCEHMLRVYLLGIRSSAIGERDASLQSWASRPWIEILCTAEVISVTDAWSQAHMCPFAFTEEETSPLSVCFHHRLHYKMDWPNSAQNNVALTFFFSRCRPTTGGTRSAPGLSTAATHDALPPRRLSASLAIDCHHHCRTSRSPPSHSSPPMPRTSTGTSESCCWSLEECQATGAGEPDADWPSGQNITPPVLVQRTDEMIVIAQLVDGNKRLNSISMPLMV